MLLPARKLFTFYASLLIFKVKVSITDPLACGFAKVAVFSVLCNKTELQKKIGESEKELKSRELQLKFEQYKGTFNFVKFDIEYRQFVQNFKKIINNIKSLEKRHKDTMTEILKTFSQSKWGSLSDSDKFKHSLVECRRCLDNKEHRQILSCKVSNT